MRRCLCLLLCCLCFFGQAQDFWSIETDSINPQKVKVAAGVQAGGALFTWTVLGSYWYKGSWGDGWYWKDDTEDWMGMDKLGHANAVYHLSWLATESYV